MTFASTSSLANFIINRHISFGGDGGFGFLSDTKEVLLSIKEEFQNPALVSINFEAWADIPQYGEMHTVISLGRDAEGIWTYEERTYESAFQMGLI